MPPRAIASVLPVTRRQAEVLAHVLKGMTNRQVARSLGISVRTVNKHMQHIHARLGVPSRVAAVARTLEALLRSSPN